jgi:hypothetical protein
MSLRWSLSAVPDELEKRPLSPRHFIGRTPLTVGRFATIVGFVAQP